MVHFHVVYGSYLQVIFVADATVSQLRQDLCLQQQLNTRCEESTSQMNLLDFTGKFSKMEII